MTESQKQKEFVENVWKLTGDYMQRGRYVSIQHDDETCSNWHSWQAAYDFTLERLEAIRQIEEEIAQQDRDISIWAENIKDFIIGAPLPEFNEGDIEAIRILTIEVARIARTLVRLEAMRDEMKRGMK